MIGEIQGNNQASTAYTWGALGPIAMRKLTTNASLWYDFGPQGETRHLTNSYGNIVDTYLYSSYGVKTVSTGPDPTGLLFGGQFGGYYSDFNTNAGVIYCRNRWYHPRLGRWLSRDPIGYGGGPNLYRYCASNPVGSSDPLGLQVNSKDPNDPANPPLETGRFRFGYGGLMNAVNMGAVAASEGLNLVAELNPLTPMAKLLTGKDNSGVGLSVGGYAMATIQIGSGPELRLIGKGIPQILINACNGSKFEQAVIAALREAKNAKAFAGMAQNELYPKNWTVK